MAERVVYARHESAGVGLMTLDPPLPIADLPHGVAQLLGLVASGGKQPGGVATRSPQDATPRPSFRDHKARSRSRGPRQGRSWYRACYAIEGARSKSTGG